MSDSEARTKFTDLQSRTEPIPYQELEQFWATLEAVDIDFMIGEWQGGDLVTGHRGDGYLGDRWWGTTFNSALDVQPIVLLDENGNKFSDTKLMNGEASLWMEEFRGEMTATMVYDGSPIHDHFKKVDDNAVVAITNGKSALDKGRYMYFSLERVQMSDARQIFTDFTKRTDQIPDAELDSFWATLAPASIEFMIGEWKGGGFDTGHRVINSLETARWFGKSFVSASDVKPLVCLDENGEKFSNVELGKGEATMWVEEFRGELVATMVYDGQPVHDHFKKIDDDTVMGIMNGRHAMSTGRYGYFYLERV